MDYWKVLGVNENSSDDEIKKSYRKLSLKHHPDRGGDGIQFKKINEAYQTLGDTNKRQMYKMNRGNPFLEVECLECLQCPECLECLEWVMHKFL